jgi:hypothetical protein
MLAKPLARNVTKAGFYLSVLISVAVLLTGCTALQSPGRLVILDSRLEPYDNMFMPWVVVGRAQNAGGSTLRYAEVDAQFYDSGGVLLASWLDSIANLPAGGVWEFHVYCFDSEVGSRVDHATVTVGSCF